MSDNVNVSTVQQSTLESVQQNSGKESGQKLPPSSLPLEVLEAIATFSDCYKAGRKMPAGDPSGIVVHSTGANNPNLKRYVNLPEIAGENIYQNYFGGPNSDDVTPHAVIGKDKNGEVRVVQILPYDICCWESGGGSIGSYNFSPAYIQFEIAEDGLTDETYFEAAFDTAAQYCALLMSEFPAITLENVVSHKEANARGYASAHGDPENWLSKFGKDMDWFREKVSGYLDAPDYPDAPDDPQKFYRVQVGAFLDRENAEDYLEKLKAAGFEGYIV